MMERTCKIYRCARKREMYLYLDEQAAPGDLPEALRKDLGALEEVMTLHLWPARKLARVRAAQVLEAIDRNGYFLQLPPTMDPGVFTHGE